MKRRTFLKATAGAGLAASALTGWDAPDVSLPAGISVADLRFGSAPTPASFPGYDPAADARALVAAGTVSPATAAIPGTLATGSYATNQRYVIKVPHAWNGKLVVAGTPAFRSEFANDAIWGDFALARGYAFASSNKGIAYNAIVATLAASPDLAKTYPVPFDLAGLESKGIGVRFGVLDKPTPIDRWNADLAALTVHAQRFLANSFRSHPSRTYAVGLSNGGAQVRSLLERYGDLVDGGVDWSGVFWSPDANILTYMPKFLAAMPEYVRSGFTDRRAAATIVAAGYPADVVQASTKNPSLWFEYYANQPSFYADVTTFAYALLLDPAASSSIELGGCTADATNPAALPGRCIGSGLALPEERARYAPSADARRAIEPFAHTGDIAKPLVSICGASDMFVTPANNATPYLAAVNAAGKGAKYWQYLVAGGTHVDAFVPLGYGLRPQLPFAWAAFDQLVAIVERGFVPTGAGTQQSVATPDRIVSA